MKRFLAFGGHNYYPAGGWADFLGHFDTQDEAEAFARSRLRYKTPLNWWHVVDSAAEIALTQGDCDPMPPEVVGHDGNNW